MRLRVLACVLSLVGAGLLWAGRGAPGAGEAGRTPPAVPVEDPRADGRDKLPIVAIVDTGVDTAHPALKERCLDGINIAEPGEPSNDLVGHGTAIAGLIAASDDDPEYCGVNPAVRILPIKVTAGDAREALPAFLAMGVDKAVELKASVICIAMGASRSTKTLDEALERAREAGIIVVAAAGVSDGSADLWPASHPWVVSCTVSELVEAELADGTRKMVEFPASRAHISGKTELIGTPFAKAIAPGGGKGTLEGSSVPCARAAGYAARLRLSHPEMKAEDLRRLLVLTGAPIELGNVFRAYRVRRISGAALTRAATEKLPADLVLLDQDTNPAPMEPGKEAKLELEILNLGPEAQACDVTVDFPKEKLALKGRIESIPPGESRKVSIDLPKFEEGSYKGVARVKGAGDENPENDWLNFTNVVMPAPEFPVILSRPRMERLRFGEKQATIAVEVTNAGQKEIKGQAVVEVDDKAYTKDVTLGPRASELLAFTFDIPDLPAGFTGIRIAAGFLVADKTVTSTELSCKLSQDTALVQYADAWATKEVILDAPAFVIEGRTSVPFLIFAPEVHTLIDSKQLHARAGRIDIRDRARGIWLYDILIEEVGDEVARTTEFNPWAPPKDTLGGKTLLRVQGNPERKQKLPEKSVRAHPDICAESGDGGPVLDPLDLIQFVEEDGWSAVVNIPILALENHMRPYIYLRGLVRYLESARNPDDARWTHFDSRSLAAEAMLRVRLHASLPKLDPAGHYYDIHVHTQCEFSRDAVEPRLAWGGPLWMLIRSAHAMGFVDDAYVAAVRHKDLAAVAAREMLFTTDHNCFLTDGDTPFAIPFRSGEAEITTLRRFVGKGANQELAMAARGGRPMGAAHALAYGHEPLKGPWHGGRNFAKGIEKTKGVIEALKKYGVDKALGVVLPKILKKIADSKHLQVEALEKLNEQLDKLKLPPAKLEQLVELCREWGKFTPEHFEELVSQAERVVGEASRRSDEDENFNAIEKVELDLAANGTYIAAHPMAGPSLHWDLDDLDRAANLVGGPFVVAEQAGRFPFAGVQVWNEEPLSKYALGHPDQLRQLNIWKQDALKADPSWHGEWMTGFLHYMNRLVKPGLMYSFHPREPRSRFFIRKLYHYAGSDAHGNFNYTTGVGATLLTHTDLMPLLAIFGQSHGASTHTSHFGCARVYAQKPAFEEVYHGRVVCTDGPLVWTELDADQKFDGKDKIWHESWDTPEKAKDVDGQIGGDGPFDGKRTALVRRSCDKIVLKYRVSDGGPLSPAIQRIDLYRLSRSDEQAAKELSAEGRGWVPKPQDKWTPASGQQEQFRALTPWAPREPGIVMLAGFSMANDEVDMRYDPRFKRCFTNPIWLTTVDIGATAEPVMVDGKAIVPPGKFVASFKCDHSMFDEGTTVLLKQFNAQGDSTAASYTLVATSSPADGFWRPQKRDIAGRETEVDDCFLTAVNKEPIPLGQPWFPKPGVDTFAVILVNPRDAHGNPLNAVAAKIEVAAPPGFDPDPDWTEVPDTAHGGNTPTDTAVVQVRPGDTVEFPKGAICHEQKIPPGPWQATGIPAEGTPFTIVSGAHTVRVLVVASELSQQPFLEPQGDTWVGVAPTPSYTKGPARVVLNNHTERTVEFPDVLAQTSRAVLYSAPDAEPGNCTVKVQSDGKEAVTEIEAVAAKLAWDSEQAKPGEFRTLCVQLLGASKPADWEVTGTVTVQNAEVVELADSVKAVGKRFDITGLPGDAAFVLKAKAVEAGQMTATGKLRARKGDR
ncbi:MAG: S8/S53 family peptidase [Planctomycetes bacterium]|nr:S8/S53 family peptidase [Planctomycetota bacterium]